jgi:hypothetical protein
MYSLIFLQGTTCWAPDSISEREALRRYKILSFLPILKRFQPFAIAFTPVSNSQARSFHMAILWHHYDRNGRDSERFTNGKPS